MDMWYSWTVRGTDVNQAVLACGIAQGDDPGLAQRQAGAVLRRSEHAFTARVEEVWPGGLQWHGRRDRHGGIFWRELAPEG